MSMVERVSEELKVALKAREKHHVAALRGIRAAFLNEMKKDGADDLAEEACTAALRRLEKQHKESIEAFDSAGRTEQADAERAELEVIQTFLPQLADEETTRRWVGEAVEQSSAASSKEVGKVMGALMKAHKGEVDGNLARSIAAELLG